MTSLKIAQLVCLFMLGFHLYQHVRSPSSTKLIAVNVWAAASTVLIAFMPA